MRRSAVRATRQAVIPLWADHLALAPSVAALIYGDNAPEDKEIAANAARI